MKKSSPIDNYLQNYSVGKKWKVIANDTGNIAQVVVIPAFAEKELLFYTLASLAKNYPSAHEYSLVLCVVNQKDHSPVDVKANNRQTIEYLNALVSKKSFTICSEDQALHPLFNIVCDSGMKLGYVDASSPGYEIPANTGGVGMARKIGMDMALGLLKNSDAASKIIISLDADTLVQENYLSVIHDYFIPDVKTAVVAYEHQMPSEAMHQAAIICYEIFLRYWILGLKYAKSPWAFHSIGSTICVTTAAYLEVRGMNKREAGEDFYFLNKLAKVGRIDSIKETCVYPSARSSTRVPFGTGKRISRFLTGAGEEEYCLYDPHIFSVLAGWLQLMREMLLSREDEIMNSAGLIHPHLKIFLKESNFPAIWSKVRRNAKDEKTLAGHFQDWFDGFKTLKMINYLTREAFPQMNMFDALDRMMAMSGISAWKFGKKESTFPLHEQMEILRFLRRIT